MFRYGLPQPLSSQMAIPVKKPFDLIKAGATQAETSLLKQYVAAEPVDSLMIMISQQEPSLEPKEVFAAVGKSLKFWLYCEELVYLHTFNNFFNFEIQMQTSTKNG